MIHLGAWSLHDAGSPAHFDVDGSTRPGANQSHEHDDSGIPLTDPRLKIAVFVDFDNIEIGVKTTLGGQFDIGLILEAIKERGEVVTKVAYGDWKRAGDHGRLLSQHAIRMVQRNLTPGGDKNGADINLALDALEMAFTHAHINAFVIVGGDSDFITLVEKLKQYDRKVFVVGGRQFTSLVMQRNCHEFIAYENLLGTRRAASPRRRRRRTRPIGRAVGAGGGRHRKGPAAREARAEGAGRPRGHAAARPAEEHAAAARLDLLGTRLRHRHLPRLHREGRRAGPGHAEAGGPQRAGGAGRQRRQRRRARYAAAGAGGRRRRDRAVTPRDPGARDLRRGGRGTRRGGGPPPPRRPRSSPLDAVQTAARLFVAAKQNPRWPMYIRQVRQYLRTADETFDERKFGFAGIVEFLRACQREGLLRLDRDRQGVLRVFPGPQFSRPAAACRRPGARGNRGHARRAAAVAGRLRESNARPATRRSSPTSSSTTRRWSWMARSRRNPATRRCRSLPPASGPGPAGRPRPEQPRRRVRRGRPERRGHLARRAHGRRHVPVDRCRVRRLRRLNPVVERALQPGPNLLNLSTLEPT